MYFKTTGFLWSDGALIFKLAPQWEASDVFWGPKTTLAIIFK